jgi:hypothetical protein
MDKRLHWDAGRGRVAVEAPAACDSLTEQSLPLNDSPSSYARSGHAL